MVHVRSRTFCCCLPVRFGVVVIALLGLVGGTLVTVAGALTAKKQAEGSKVALIVQMVMYGLLAVLSLFGLIGAIVKRRTLILVYYSMLITHLIFSVSSGAFSLYRLFKDAPQTLQECLDGQEEGANLDTCTRGVQIMKGVMVSVYIIIWLLEIWGCVIVNNYAKQLEDEEEASFKTFDSESNSSQTRQPQWN